MQIDTILRLVSVGGFEAKERDFYKIRALSEAKMCAGEEKTTERSVTKDFLLWSKSSNKEFRSLMKHLRILAENEKFTPIKKMKRVGDQNQIIQLSGNQSRAWGFFDENDPRTFILTNAFMIKGSKLKNETKEIKRAESLRNNWMNGICLVDENCADCTSEEKCEMCDSRPKLVNI